MQLTEIACLSSSFSNNSSTQIYLNTVSNVQISSSDRDVTLRAARSCVEAAFREGIIHGRLVIKDAARKVHEYGQAVGECHLVVELSVEDEAFWTRMYLSHGLGCAFDDPRTLHAAY